MSTVLAYTNDVKILSLFLNSVNFPATVVDVVFFEYEKYNVAAITATAHVRKNISFILILPSIKKWGATPR